MSDILSRACACVPVPVHSMCRPCAVSSPMQANTFAPEFEFYPMSNLSIPAPGGGTVQSPCEGSVVVQAECPMTYLGIRLLPIPEDKRADFYVAPGLPCWRCPMPIFYSGALNLSVRVRGCVFARTLVTTLHRARSAHLLVWNYGHRHSRRVRNVSPAEQLTSYLGSGHLC